MAAKRCRNAARVAAMHQSSSLFFKKIRDQNETQHNKQRRFANIPVAGEDDVDEGAVVEIVDVVDEVADAAIDTLFELLF